MGHVASPLSGLLLDLGIPSGQWGYVDLRVYLSGAAPLPWVGAKPGTGIMCKCKAHLEIQRQGPISRRVPRCDSPKWDTQVLLMCECIPTDPQAYRRPSWHWMGLHGCMGAHACASIQWARQVWFSHGPPGAQHGGEWHHVHMCLRGPSVWP